MQTKIAQESKKNSQLHEIARKKNCTKKRIRNQQNYSIMAGKKCIHKYRQKQASKKHNNNKTINKWATNKDLNRHGNRGKKHKQPY